MLNTSYLNNHSIDKELLEFSRLAMDSSKNSTKILWANYKGDFEVQHGTQIICRTKDLNNAIEEYNNIWL